MSPEMHSQYARLIEQMNIHGPVLEIGATDDNCSLINLPCLVHIEKRIGINLDDDMRAPYLMKVNANHMDIFPDNHFDLVLCNSVLEHDLYFWKSVAEIKRITAPGGYIMIGVPSFGEMNFFRPWQDQSMLAKWMIKIFTRLMPESMKASSLTLGRHLFPDDYYRFSKSMVQEYMMSGLIDVQLYELMLPPRILAVGRKHG